MSEWEAVVYCTCFQDGLTREPPFPTGDLTVNRFGVVTLVGSTDHANDPDALWWWRFGLTTDEGLTDQETSPCAHDNMHLVDEIFYWPSARSHMGRYPTLEHLVETGEYPLAIEVLYRPEGDDYPSGGIWVCAAEAPPLLEEVRRLRREVPNDSPNASSNFIETLESLLEASADTRNPIIVHYNGLIDGAW